MQAAYPYLQDDCVDAQAIANAIKNHNTAWSNFYKVPGSSIPTFHKKGYSKRYQTNAHYKQDADTIGEGNVYLTDKRHIRLPKLGSVRFNGSDRIYRIFERACETRIGTITVSMDECGNYYISLQIGSVCPFHKTLPSTGNIIGIDLNVENFCTDSDGNVIENPKFRRNLQEKLAREQRKLSRKAERAKKERRPLQDSKNYQKQRVKVAKLHKAAAAQREAFQHDLSKSIVESQDVICVENLRTKNMMLDSRLAGSIADCGWASFGWKLQYKAGLYGKTFLKVPAYNTTQTCHVCGYKMSGNNALTLADRVWTCPCCKTHHLRDYNAAINIKIRGLELLQSS